MLSRFVALPVPLTVPCTTAQNGDIWGHVEVNDVALTAGDHFFEVTIAIKV